MWFGGGLGSCRGVGVRVGEEGGIGRGRGDGGWEEQGRDGVVDVRVYKRIAVRRGERLLVLYFWEYVSFGWRR